MIATDERAMWGRKCPHCNGYWRTAGAGLSGTNVCCYCGKHSEAFECLSDAQQAYVEACCILYTQVIESGKDGRCAIKISDLIAQAMTSEDGQAAAPPEFFAESQRQTRFTCEACDNLNDVLGRFAWCSTCGTRNDGEMLRQDIGTIKATLIANGNPVSALKEAVDAFDAVGRNLAQQLVAHVPMTKARRDKWEKANFQQVELTARNLKADFDIDILDKLSPEAIAEIRLRFHRRHLHAHRGGVVDRKYVEDTRDSSVQVGQLVTESRDMILAFLPTVLKLGDNFLKGFHSVIPVRDSPIRHRREKTARMERHAKERARGPS